MPSTAERISYVDFGVWVHHLVHEMFFAYGLETHFVK